MDNILDAEHDLLSLVFNPSHEEGEAFVEEVYENDKEQPMITPPDPVLTPFETIISHREQLRACWREHGLSMCDTGASERLAALLEPLLPQPILPSVQTLVDLNEYLIDQLEEFVAQRDGDQDYEPDDGGVKNPESEFCTGAYEDSAYEEGYYSSDAGYFAGAYGDFDYEEENVNSDGEYFTASDTVWCWDIYSKKGKGLLRMRKGKQTARRACKIAAKISRVGAYGTNKGIASISFGTYGPKGMQY